MAKNLLPQDGSAIIFTQTFEPVSADLMHINLLERIAWRAESAILFGRKIPLPRLVAWYGDLPYRYSGITHQPQPWTAELLEIKTVAEALAGTSFNSVLLNLYRDGADSMGWHADDEKELGTNPTIASISFGATRKFQMRHKVDRALRVETNLTHGSCLVMAGAMQDALAASGAEDQTAGGCAHQSDVSADFGLILLKQKHAALDLIFALAAQHHVFIAHQGESLGTNFANIGFGVAEAAVAHQLVRGFAVIGFKAEQEPAAGAQSCMCCRENEFQRAEIDQRIRRRD